MDVFFAPLVTGGAYGASFIAWQWPLAYILKLTGSFEFAVVGFNEIAASRLKDPVLLNFLCDGSRVLAEEFSNIFKSHAYVQTLFNVNSVLELQMALVSSDFFRHKTLLSNAGRKPNSIVQEFHERLNSVFDG